MEGQLFGVADVNPHFADVVELALTMITALRLVMAGEVYVPPALLASLQALENNPPVEAEATPSSGLTPRQVEIVGLMGQGLSNKVIAKVISGKGYTQLTLPAS